jgi:hypothetical protein
MALITGSSSQGEKRVYSASVQCDACPARATREEAATPERAARLAVWRAQEQAFVTHDRGRKWLCPACRLRSLPEHLRRLFPRLLAQHGLGPTADGDEAGKPRRGRGRRK